MRSSRRTLALFALSGLQLLVAGTSMATIDSISACGKSGWSRYSTVPVVTGGNTITVRGFLVDTSSRLELTGVTGNTSVRERSSGKLKIWIDVGEDQAGRTGTLHIRYGIELVGHDSFTFKVHQRPRIDTLLISTYTSPPRPADLLLVGEKYKLKVEGGGPYRFKPPASIRVFSDHFVPTTAGPLSLGPDDFPLDVEGCSEKAGGFGYVHAQIIEGDVEPYLDPSTLFKVETPQSCGGENRPTLASGICSRANAPTSADPTTTTDVSLPGVKWGVRNVPDSRMSRGIRVRLMWGTNILDMRTVADLDPQELKTFVHTRRESRRRVLKVRNCSICFDTLFYNWVEPNYRVEVDVDNALKEGGAGEANNKREYRP